MQGKRQEQKDKNDYHGYTEENMGDPQTKGKREKLKTFIYYKFLKDFISLGAAWHWLETF